MIFSSFVFIFLFLPLVLGVYFVIKNRSYRNVVLLLASLLFYAWGEPKYIVLILFSIVINYMFAFLLERAEQLSRRKLYLSIGIIINILLLVIFKYLDFGMYTLERLIGVELPLTHLALPIGISFYTFQAISYLIDVFRNKIQAQRNIIKMGTYIAMFPQLMAGPIVRYDQIAEKLDNRTETSKDVALGLRRFALGFAKKVLIANNAAIIADSLYGAASVDQIGAPLLWLAAIAYAFQIYFDFSGYSDMAIGLGRVFGFTYPENFDYPYNATSITAFWRRWHMSLTSWFRDYVYIPLGGNRVSKPRWMFNVLVVWMLTGLWHGAAWNFVLWGLYFGVLLILERTVFKKVLSRIPKVFGWAGTMFLVVLGWVLFRVEGLSNLLGVLKEMFISPGTLDLLFASYDMVVALPFLVIAAIACVPQFKIWGTAFTSKNVLCEGIGYLFAFGLYAFSIFVLVSSTYNPFIYFRF